MGTGPVVAAAPARTGLTGASAALRRLLRYLRPYRARWITMLAVAIASLAATVTIPLLTKAVIDGPVQHRDQLGLWVLGTAATALGCGEAVLWIVRRWLVAHATMGVEADIRNDLYARLQVLPLAFHGRWQSGQLLSRIMNDLATVRRFLSFVVVFLLLNTCQIIVVIVILLVLYWPLGLIVCAAVVPVAATVAHFRRQYTRLSRQAQDQAGQVATQVEESAAGLRTIKAFGREAHVIDRFDAAARTLHDVGIRKVSVSARFSTLLEAIPNLTLILVLGVGAYAAGRGLVTMGTLVAFITLMLSLVWPVSSLGFLLSATQEAMTAADRIVEIFDAPREIRDGDARGGPGPLRGGRLELRDVGFRFADSADWVLRHVNLTVEPGETIALVGATGSGKSVLAMLLSRLYDVTEGEIRIDGRDIRELTLSALRQTVTTAFEDPTLFSMSVAENVRLGRPRATDAEVHRAITVSAADFVYGLPFGLDTRIGEQGMSLSGGQRQRLALARAVLAAPTILVLDDTLSALDVHTEAAVTDALRQVLRSGPATLTGIVIAHRASTVLLADRVALLDGGGRSGSTIVELGTHTDLLARVPAYRYLLAADDELDDGCERTGEWQRDADTELAARSRSEFRAEQQAVVNAEDADELAAKLRPR